MTDIDLSTAALERLLQLNEQRTPGEWKFERSWNEGLCPRLATHDGEDYGGVGDSDYELAAAAVNHLAPLAKELLRLRSLTESDQGNVEHTLKHFGLEPWHDGRSIHDGQRPWGQHVSMALTSLLCERDDYRQDRNRLRAAVEQHVGRCTQCKGTGAYSEWMGSDDPCAACAGLRAALKGEN